MSKNYQIVNNLKISDELLSFVNKELLKDLDISSEKFWEGFDNAVHDLAPQNKELIQIRENLQKKIDDWHINNKGCLLYTSPSPRDLAQSRMPSSA